MLSRNKIIGLAVAAVVVIMALRSCGSDDKVTTQVAQPQQQIVQPVVPKPAQEVAPQYDQQQPQVVYVEQPPQQQVIQQQPSGGITAGHLAAGALGYFAGKSSNSNSGYSGSNRTVINKTYINKTYRTARPSRSYYGSTSRRSSSFTRSTRRR